ncbi:MAG: hypothetical protein LBJ92_00725 [Holosporales bacterium]|jgi:NADH:ubiquinone oxidoreductase subunit 3 (subunit A)|nr:hypothetical protein [Holosporales bacterium]
MEYAGTEGFITIIAVVGAMSVAALLVSKISSFLDNGKRAISRHYECGFKNPDPDFVYASENYGLISLFVVIETALIWFLLCCSIGILDKKWDDKIFIKVLLGIIMILMIAAYKICYPGKNGVKISPQP